MDFHVTTSTEFQSALAAAASNGGDDTIFMAGGTYYGNFKFTSAEANGLTIKPEEVTPAGSVILDGQQNAYVIMLNGNGLEVNFVLEGLIIQNGNSKKNGGGIYAMQLPYSARGSFLILNCNIKNNTALEDGGGVYFYYFRSVIMKNSTISNNSAFNNGGGVFGGVYDGSLTFTNNTISNNSAFNNGGGGIYGQVGNGSLTFTNNIIDNNSAYNGGGLCTNAWLGTVTYFINNIISNNSASNNGGGIYGEAGSGSSLTFTNNIISNNSAILSGGISCHTYDGVTIFFTNNTIAFNNGRGINCDPGPNDSSKFYNNIIWGNEFNGDGSDIYIAGYGLESNFFNNIYTSAFALWDNERGNQIIDPLFYDPNNSDFHMIASSPAINAGLNTAPNLAETDQEGNPRIADGTVDIGAYERSTVAMHPADLDENWIISQTEFDNYNTAWRANSEWAIEPTKIPMNYVTRAGYILKKGGAYENIGVGKPGTWVQK